jgi:hypothetical protein
LTSGQLGRFLTAKIREPASPKNARKLNYARGLYVDSNRLSIAIACNAGEAADARTKFAAQVLSLFVPEDRR